MATPAVLRIDIVSNARNAVAGIGQTDTALGRLGGAGKKMGLALAAGAAAGGVALVALGKDAYRAASDVQQSFGAVESVFGKNAAQVQKWAKGAAESVGLATSEYANLSALLGSQLTNMGRSQAAAAKETDSLIKLGADLAATYGGSVADAVGAVSSVLKGETDPIERYGISIKAVDINAQLAAKGQDKLTGAALKQATATAALTLVTKQSTAAQGAFGREANTAAGQQARMAANVENLKAKLGAGLLPVATATFGFLNTQAFPAMARLGAEMRERFGPAAQQITAVLRDRVVPAARQLYSWFVEKIVPGIRGFVVPIVTALRGHFERIGKTFQSNSENLSGLRTFLQRVAEVAAKLAPIVGKVLGGAITVLSKGISGAITVVSTLVGWLTDAIKFVTDLSNAIKNSPIGKAAGAIGGALGKIFHTPVSGGVGHLAGRVAGGTRGMPQLAGFAAGQPGGGYARAAVGTAAAGFGVVDARRAVTINIYGATDPTATAAAVRRVLRADDVRRGRVPTYAPATGWTG